MATRTSPLAYKIANIFKLDARAMLVAQLEDRRVSVSSSGGTTLEDWYRKPPRTRSVR